VPACRVSRPAQGDSLSPTPSEEGRSPACVTREGEKRGGKQRQEEEFLTSFLGASSSQLKGGKPSPWFTCMEKGRFFQREK